MDDRISELEDALRRVTQERDRLRDELSLRDKYYSVSSRKDRNNPPDRFCCINCADCERSMAMHPSVAKARLLASRGQRLTVTEWQDIMGALELYLKDFYDNLLKEQEKLTEPEFKVCVMSRLHFVPSEVSTLLGLSQQRISNIRSTANLKLFQSRGASGFDEKISLFGN